MEKRKFIIDTDPGVDDAFAIITALSHDGIDVKGITTVAGNKSLDYVTKNAMKLVKLMNADCSVYQGASASLRQMNSDSQNHNDAAGDTHGGDGLGDVDLPWDDTSLASENAVDFILETIKQYPNEIEILAIGPVTNLALAIKRDPDTFKLVKTIWSMGGGVRRGNLTPVSEFNYWFDPEAAKILYSIGKDVDIYMFGLDVTYNTFFTMNDLFFLREEGGKIGKVMYEIAQAYASSYWNNRKITGAVLHDVVPMVYAIDPTISLSRDVYRCAVSICVEDGLTKGQTVVDLDDRFKFEKNAFVVMDAQSRVFKEKFIEIVSKEAVELYREYVVS